MQVCLSDDIDKLICCLEVNVEIKTGYGNNSTLPMIMSRKKEPASPVSIANGSNILEKRPEEIIILLTKQSAELEGCNNHSLIITGPL